MTIRRAAGEGRARVAMSGGDGWCAGPEGGRRAAMCSRPVNSGETVAAAVAIGGSAAAPGAGSTVAAARHWSQTLSFTPVP
jgi:hypothetical protein